MVTTTRATGRVLSRRPEVDDSYAYFTAGGGNHERLRVDKTAAKDEGAEYDDAHAAPLS